MSDEDMIRDLQARWSARDADKDARGLSELYALDGKYVSRRGEIVGRDAIRADLEQRAATNPPDRSTLHLFGSPTIAIDGDQAESECGYVAYGRIGDDPWAIMSAGRFFWRLKREGDRWLAAEVHNRAVGPSSGPASSKH
jgi:uncharacterized protein (TIGR02246 family)